MKRDSKDIGKSALLLVASILGWFIVFVIFIYLLFSYTVGGIRDHINYKDSLKAKEDVFRMIYENQEEYEKLVSDMADILEESGEDYILVEETEDYKSNGIVSSLPEDYPIMYIASERHEDGYLEVDFHLTFTPSPYEYWGVYYSESGEPVPWGNGEVVEEDGKLIERGTFYICDMEKITDNWFYYQCRT